MTCFLPLLVQGSPLDRLVGSWTSVETVQTSAGPKTLRLKGENRWVFKGRLLEIRERYTVEGEKEPGNTASRQSDTEESQGFCTGEI